MSIGNKNKDHLKEHAGVELVAPVTAATSDDPLRFWTGHPTENTLINLYPFAVGESQNPHPKGGGNWAGSFGARPDLIQELAPSIQARCTLAAQSTTKSYLAMLRAWWRLFDALEATPDQNGQTLARVESVADLNALHEAVAHKRNMDPQYFNYFLRCANDARKIFKPRLPDLLWTPPKRSDPIRHMIPDDQARALKIILKQDWEAVRRTWARHDAIRVEAGLRATIASNSIDAICHGESTPLCEEDELLLKHWEHLQRIQQATGLLLPSGDQLREGQHHTFLLCQGLEVNVMRAIIFPTVEEADIAFHLALMGSGWNPSSLARLNASKPDLLFDHPKNVSQSVLTFEDEEVAMKTDKPRSRGKTQYCIALKKHKASPPAIVAAYLKRSAPLREQLQRDCDAAKAELDRLHRMKIDQAAIERQFKKVQRLQEGCRSVWLYVNIIGKIGWLDWEQWKRYGKNGSMVSYLDRVLDRMNIDRAKRSEPLVDYVTPSDFRDIYARWVYIQTGGNILAVMLALGHSTPRSTGKYLDNNIFNAENDEHARRFMTNLFSEIELGRIDLTILAQLVRHGPLTQEMLDRLDEYRRLMRSRVGVGCVDPYHPPGDIAPGHRDGKLCGTQRCLRDCPNAKYLPESLDGIAMRVEELIVMSDHLPRETWLRGEFPEELEAGEYLLTELYVSEIVTAAREKWRGKIACGEHLIPGLALLIQQEVV
jgi:hypothetical protein